MVPTDIESKSCIFCISILKVGGRIFSYFLAFSKYLNFNRVNLQGHDLFHFSILQLRQREDASEATIQHFRFRWLLPLHFSKSVNLSGIYYDQSISQIKYIFPSFYSFARGKEGRCFGSNYSAGRTNENRIDLNRNFPTWKQKGQTISELKQVSF